MDGIGSLQSKCVSHIGRGEIATTLLWATVLTLSAGFPETVKAQFLGQNFVSGNASGATAAGSFSHADRGTYGRRRGGS